MLLFQTFTFILSGVIFFKVNCSFTCQQTELLKWIYNCVIAECKQINFPSSRSCNDSCVIMCKYDRKFSKCYISSCTTATYRINYFENSWTIKNDTENAAKDEPCAVSRTIPNWNLSVRATQLDIKTIKTLVQSMSIVFAMFAKWHASPLS